MGDNKSPERYDAGWFLLPGFCACGRPISQEIKTADPGIMLFADRVAEVPAAGAVDGGWCIGAAD